MRREAFQLISFGSKIAGKELKLTLSLALVLYKCINVTWNINLNKIIVWSLTQNVNITCCHLPRTCHLLLCVTCCHIRDWECIELTPMNRQRERERGASLIWQINYSPCLQGKASFVYTQAYWEMNRHQTYTHNCHFITFNMYEYLVVFGLTWNSQKYISAINLYFPLCPSK